ncbi:MAG: mechanosensitive ion channel family protein [Muribaculaceae bacterium]
MIEFVQDYINQLASRFDISADFVHHYIYVLLILLVALALGVAVKYAVGPLFLRIARRTSLRIDDYLFTDSIISVLSRLLPMMFVSLVMPLLYYGKESTTLVYVVFYRAVNAYIVVLVAKLITYVLNNYLVYSKTERSDRNNHYLDMVMQFCKIVIYFFTFIIMLSVILDKNPTTMLAGLGAMATIILLVFQDSILGFVARVQLNINKMLKVGDWVEVRDSNINGYVVKVNLTTIKIRNFDNSISTIPPYKLIQNSFRNWEGIKVYGGRQARMKLMIDVDSVRFADEKMLSRLKSSNLITETDASTPYQRISNVTLYRRFIERFLNDCEVVDKEKWLMVRQTPTEGMGMPIEMYFYIKEWDFVRFEELSSEIYEYCLASATYFDLKIYQSITKSDLK